MLTVKMTFETIVEGKKIKHMQRTHEKSPEYRIRGVMADSRTVRYGKTQLCAVLPGPKKISGQYI
jgi:hypothetical protein